MNKEELIEKLRELGIDSDNVYPKKSFKKDSDIYIGLYLREMQDDFYFYNDYDKKIYKIPVTDEVEKYEMEKFGDSYKYLIPKGDWEIVWEDVPYQEKPDLAYNSMTVRQYACIHLRVPDSGLPWLDEIIKSAPPVETHERKSRPIDFGPM